MGYASDVICAFYFSFTIRECVSLIMHGILIEGLCTITEMRGSRNGLVPCGGHSYASSADRLARRLTFFLYAVDQFRAYRGRP